MVNLLTGDITIAEIRHATWGPFRQEPNYIYAYEICKTTYTHQQAYFLLYLLLLLPRFYNSLRPFPSLHFASNNGDTSGGTAAPRKGGEIISEFIIEYGTHIQLTHTYVYSFFFKTHTRAHTV